MTDDLWPEISALSEDSPISILKNQARILGEKTRGRVEARVSFMPIKNGIKVDFYIWSQFLDYNNRLFYVVCTAGSYPAVVVYGDKKLKAVNVPEFRQHVKDILQDPNTRSLLTTLIAQSDDP